MRVGVTLRVLKGYLFVLKSASVFIQDIGQDKENTTSNGHQQRNHPQMAESVTTIIDETNPMMSIGNRLNIEEFAMEICKNLLNCLQYCNDNSDGISTKIIQLLFGFR